MVQEIKNIDNIAVYVNYDLIIKMWLLPQLKIYNINISDKYNSIKT